MGKAQLLHGLFPDLFFRRLSVGGVVESSKSAVGATVSHVTKPTQPLEFKWKGKADWIYLRRDLGIHEKASV
jgi:hypothetical protein